MLVVVVPAVVALVLLERRAEARGRLPLLPPSLLRVPSMRLGLPVLMVFFVAVGAWTWLDMSIEITGWAGRVFAVMISVVLIGNACQCFVVGASTSWQVHVYEDPRK